MSGAVSVQLTRTTAAKPSEWTVAGGMELVTGQQTTVLGTPTFSSYSIQHPAATLAPGAYAVLVSNYAAFERTLQSPPTTSWCWAFIRAISATAATRSTSTRSALATSGSVAPPNGYVPSYRVDHVNYQNASPWPTEPDGNGPALIRIHTADYGNDPINWWASNAGGTPGEANLVMDSSTPSVPANLAGQALLSPTAEISLTWSASSDPQSYVAYYDIYRNGSRRRHFDHDLLCGHGHLVRNELHLYRDGRQPRRIREQPRRRASASACLR